MMGKEKKMNDFLINLGFVFDEYEKGGVYELRDIQVVIDDCGGMINDKGELLAFDGKKDLKNILLELVIKRLLESEKEKAQKHQELTTLKNKVIERGGRINKLLDEIEEAKQIINKIK